MPFGPAKGFDFVSFCKLIKRLTLVVIDGTSRVEVDLSLEFYNTSIDRIKVVKNERFY